MRRLGAGLALVLLLLAAGPASAASRSVREQVDAIEMDIRELQQKLLEMQDVQSSIHQALADLRSALALDSPDRRSPADLAARLDSVETDLRVVQENQNDVRHRVSVISDKVDTVYRRQAQMADASARAAAAQDPAGGTVTDGSGDAASDDPPPIVDEESVGTRTASGGLEGMGGLAGSEIVPVQPLVDPEEIYQAARADYGRGSFELALAGFEEFLERFPESELADDAQYLAGECHYSAGRLDEAVEAFDRVLRDHPGANKSPDAAYKKGLALLELNRTAEGIIQLQHVKDTWPGAPAGRLARTKLQSMGLL